MAQRPLMGLNCPEQPHLGPPPQTPCPWAQEPHLRSAPGLCSLPAWGCSSVGLQLCRSLALATGPAELGLACRLVWLNQAILAPCLIPTSQLCL